MHGKDSIEKIADFLGVESLSELCVDDIAAMLTSALFSMDVEDEVRLKTIIYIKGVVGEIAFLHKNEKGETHLYKIYLDYEKFDTIKLLTLFKDNDRLLNDILGKLGMVGLWIKK